MNNPVPVKEICHGQHPEEGLDECQTHEDHDECSTKTFCDEESTASVNFDFKANSLQLIFHWIIAILIGVSLRMTTFPQAMIAAEMGVNNYTRETSFLVAFGFTKALSNLIVGWASDRYGRRTPHIFGWTAGLILGSLLILITATAVKNRENSRETDASWTWYVIADIFLGAQQGLTWTTNIFMFIDILGPKHRALASGISNSTGYLASAVVTYAAAAITTEIAFKLVLVSSILGISISFFILKDTTPFVKREAGMNGEELVVTSGEREVTSESTAITGGCSSGDGTLRTETSIEPSTMILNHQTTSFRITFSTTSWHNKSTAVICLSGLITNLVTSLAWGLIMIWGKQQLLSDFRLANLSSFFTFAKAFSQIIFSHISDRRRSRKFVLLGGFSTTVIGLAITSLGGITNLSIDKMYHYLLIGGLITGCGIGSVYCVMTGAISDHTSPQARASAIGVYKLWRDSGYAFGGLLTGIVADVSGGSFIATTLVVAGLVILLIVLIVIYYCEALYTPGTITEEESGSSGVRWHELQKLPGLT